MSCGADAAAAAVAAASGAAGGLLWPGFAAVQMGDFATTPEAAGSFVAAWLTGMHFAAAAALLLTGLGVPLPFAGTGALRPPAAGRGLAMPGRMCCGRSVCPVWRGDCGGGVLNAGG